MLTEINRRQLDSLMCETTMHSNIDCTPLSVLVELYNAVLDHLTTVATTSVQGLLWPVDFSPSSFIQGGIVLLLFGQLTATPLMNKFLPYGVI